jgi:hypothetical protein
MTESFKQLCEDVVNFSDFSGKKSKALKIPSNNQATIKQLHGEDDIKMLTHSSNLDIGGSPRDKVFSNPDYTLHDKIKFAKIPHDTHASDLYAKDSPELRNIISKHEVANREKVKFKTFRDSIDNDQWLELPFQNNDAYKYSK